MDAAGVRMLKEQAKLFAELPFQASAIKAMVPNGVFCDDNHASWVPDGELHLQLQDAEHKYVADAYIGKTRLSSDPAIQHLFAKWVLRGAHLTNVIDTTETRALREEASGVNSGVPGSVASIQDSGAHKALIERLEDPHEQAEALKTIFTYFLFVFKSKFEFFFDQCSKTNRSLKENFKISNLN